MHNTKQETMKTIKRLIFFIVALSIICLGCSKYDDQKVSEKQFTSGTNLIKSNAVMDATKPWSDDFTTPISLSTNWKVYGNPQPMWVQSAYGRNGLFDNNGPSPTKNFAVSVLPIGGGCGYTLEAEVMLKVINPDGTCICPGISISKEQNPVLKDGEFETAISMRIIFAGTEATWFPAKFRGHSWIVMEYINANGIRVISDILPADNYNDMWHILKIVVHPSRSIRFYIDDELTWAPVAPVPHDMMSKKNVILGYTSDGNPLTYAGVAYHNWVRTSMLLSSHDIY